MKKLVIATDTFFPKRDGITRFLSNIIPELTSNYNITIIAPSYDKKYEIGEYKGAKVVKFPIRKFSVSGYSPAKSPKGKIKSIIKDADIVWVHSAAPLGKAAITIGRKLKKPVIAFIHSMEWEQLIHIMVEHKKLKKYMIPLVSRYARYVYNKCTILMVPSLEVVHELDLAGITTRKLLVHLGVDSDYFVPPQHGKVKAKKKLHLNPNKIIIGYTGRISKEKNLSTLAKAVAGLQKKYPEIFLYIVGDGKRSEIEKHINKGYKITGFVSNVVPHLQAMDIFVLPSLTETSSLSTMEAMSSGLPVIATPVGHVKEYIKNGRNGMTFPKENDFVLRKKLEMLIINPELREAMGNTARNTIVKKYHWERTIVEIEKILERF